MRVARVKWDVKYENVCNIAKCCTRITSIITKILPLSKTREWEALSACWICLLGIKKKKFLMIFRVKIIVITPRKTTQQICKVKTCSLGMHRSKEPSRCGRGPAACQLPLGPPLLPGPCVLIRYMRSQTRSAELSPSYQANEASLKRKLNHYIIWTKLYILRTLI